MLLNETNERTSPNANRLNIPINFTRNTNNNTSNPSASYMSESRYTSNTTNSANDKYTPHKVIKKPAKNVWDEEEDD